MAPQITLSTPRLPRPYAGGRPSYTRPRVRRTRVAPWLAGGVVLALFAASGLIAYDAWSRRDIEIAPRHRAEALCFLLAQPPVFAPPIAVEPSVALVRGRFASTTPAAFALQETMHFEDQHVLRQWREQVGDYDVALFWLRLPGDETRHWLVLAWMEDADLAVCNFRFSGSTPDLSPLERAWGDHIVRRLLQPENFRRDVLPPVRLRVTEGRTMPSFGPHPA